MSKVAPERLLAGALVVHNRAMEEVRYYFDRAKCLGLSSLSAPILGYGIFLILNLETLPRKGTLSTALIGIFLVVLSLYVGLLASFGLFSKKPAIIVGPGGITYATGWNAQGFIPWADVVSITNKHRGWVELALVPDRRPDATTLWKALVRKASEPERIMVPCSHMNVSAESFEVLSRAYMKSSHDAQPPG